jgi:glycosyltransferase involved in cell wall biosynthesis
MMSRPTVSVVVCTCNRPRELQECIDSLKAQSVPPLEIIIAENRTRSEATVRIANDTNATYEFVANGGVSVARNRGWQVATGDVVAYIDDDAEAEPDWIERLSYEFEDPSIAAIAGRIIPTRMESAFERSAYRRGILGPVDACRTTFSNNRSEWFEALNFGCIANGANMAFRREIIQRFPFDERLGRGLPVESFADHHSFFCIVANGFTAVYSDKPVVRHPVPSGEEEFRKKELNNLRAAGGYCTLLWCEWPEYRGRLISYLASGFRGEAREFRQGHNEISKITRFTKVRAGLAGSLRYFLHAFGRDRQKASSSARG